MTQEEAVAKIAELREKAMSLLGEMKIIAREHDLSFDFYLEGQDYYASKLAFVKENGYESVEAFKEADEWWPETFEWTNEENGYWTSSSDFC